MSAHTSPADPGNHDRQTATDKLCLQKICQKLGQNADKKIQTKLANTEDCRKLRKVADKVCVPQLDKVCLSLINFVCTSKSWNWRCDHAAKTRGRFSNSNGLSGSLKGFEYCFCHHGNSCRGGRGGRKLGFHSRAEGSNPAISPSTQKTRNRPRD